MNSELTSLATTDIGNILDREYFLDMSIHALWAGMPVITGPAFTVQLFPGDNLMLHSAIYEAPAGSVIVVDGADSSHAVAGGNVCAVAKQRGIQGFVVDGVVRDLSEITDMQFPVYAKGVFPVPGIKKQFSELAQPIVCGGVSVHTGDTVVADIEGIAVIPASKAAEVLAAAAKSAEAELGQSLAEWETSHRRKVDHALRQAKG